MKRFLNVLAISALSICPLFFSGCSDDEGNQKTDFYERSQSFLDALEFTYKLMNWDGFYMTEDIKTLINGQRISYVDGSYIYYSDKTIYYTSNLWEFPADLNQNLTRVVEYDPKEQDFSIWWDGVSSVSSTYFSDTNQYYLSTIRNNKIWIGICDQNKVQTGELYSNESFPERVANVNVGYGNTNSVPLKVIGVHSVTDDYLTLNIGEKATAVFFKNGVVKFIDSPYVNVIKWYNNSIYAEGSVSTVYDLKGNVIADGLHDLYVHPVYPVSYTEYLELTSFGSIYRKTLTSDKSIWTLYSSRIFHKEIGKTSFQILDDTSEWFLVLGTNTLLDGTQEKVTFKLNINDGEIQII